LNSRFWRDNALPFIEIRTVSDGRQVSHAKHTHDTFSIGAITAGHSNYLNARSQTQISQGSVVVVNPETVHACNPIKGERWAYQMFYVDTAWLGRLQQESGYSTQESFMAFDVIHTRDPAIHSGLVRLHAILTSPCSDALYKHDATIDFFIRLQQAYSARLAVSTAVPHAQLKRAAEFIHEHCAEPLTLDDISAAAELSASYLIRAFKDHYGLTPHAYLINRRIQLSRQWLRQGYSLADVAVAAGFADQAHFHRTFKRHLSATPGHYRS
jgi:AraC-like DNA-binding protein